MKKKEMYAKGLKFQPNRDGTCSLVGLGACRSRNIKIPPVSPDGYRVTRIGNHAFERCRSLTSVTIPDSVTSIGDRAFSYCSSITSVTIPVSVTSIDECAFVNCTDLTSVYISDIAAWCNIAFRDSYANPLYYARHLYLNGTLVTELTIPEGVTSIGRCAFYNCSKLASVMIPDNVTSIGGSAFSGCSSLKSVTIGNGVRSIGGGVFVNCRSLTSMTIPESVMHIGGSAFHGCSLLKKNGRFKVTNGRMKCMGFQFEVGKYYECDGEPKLCKNGFHFVENAFDLFNYYSGTIGKDIRVFDVECDGVSTETDTDSKRVCKKIRLVREYKSFAELLNL